MDQIFINFEKFYTRENAKDFVLNYHESEDPAAKAAKKKLTNRHIMDLFKDFVDRFPPTDESYRRYRMRLLQYQDNLDLWNYMKQRVKEDPMEAAAWKIKYAYRTALFVSLDELTGKIHLQFMTYPRFHKPNIHQLYCRFNGQVFRFVYNNGQISSSDYELELL